MAEKKKKQEIFDLLDALAIEVGALRNENRASFKTVRDELHELRSDIQTLQSDSATINRIERRLDHLQSHLESDKASTRNSPTHNAPTTESTR
jgi:predicted phage gp36 major capsid-like protein